MTARTHRSVAGLAGAALALTGCTSLPFGGGEESSSSSTTTAERQVESYVLDDAQAAETIPDPLPGWDRTETDDTPSRSRTTDPAECVDVLMIGPTRQALEEHQSGEAEASARTGSGGSLRIMTVFVASHDRPVDRAVLDRVAEALPGCSAFALHGEEVGAVIDERVSAEALQVEPVGQQSVGVRKSTVADIDGEQRRLYLDTFVAREGNTLAGVTITHTSGDADTQALHDTVQDVVDAVPEAAG